MLDGREIIEMWSDLLLDSVVSQRQSLDDQMRAVQELTAQLQRPDKLGPLNPAMRFFDWDDLPAFQRDLNRWPTDMANFYQHCWASWFTFVSAVTHQAWSAPRR